jgi:hypothetical protein
MNVRRSITLCAVAGLVAATPARAQKLELAPFAGYRFGGSFENATTGASYGIQAAFAYGGTIEMALGGQNRLHVLYSRQETEFDTLGAATVPITVQYVQVGGTRDMTRRGTARPFVTGALGLGIASFPGSSAGTQTKFGMHGAIGVTTPRASRFVARAEFRGYLTFVGDQAVAGTCGGAGCNIAFASGALLQGEAAVGLGLRF